MKSAKGPVVTAPLPPPMKWGCHMMECSGLGREWSRVESQYGIETDGSWACSASSKLEIDEDKIR